MARLSQKWKNRDVNLLEVAEVKTIITSIVNANNRKYRVNTSQRSEKSALAKGPGSAHT